MMSRSFFNSAIALLVSSIHIHNVAGQVTTDCQPLNTTGCPPDPAFGMDFNFNFNSTPISGTWETTVGPVKYTPQNGAEFTISKQGESPTIRSKFYIFFGRVEIHLKAAPGVGIISSMMMLSDDLDEIDWEIMGGNVTHAETNYFGKGQQDYHNAIYYPVQGGTIADYHNYTTVWTKDSLEFFIDGQKVRTLLPKDANNTNNYPQTPMRISLGIWAAGDPRMPQGTREWAGGDTDYSKVPFSMFVRNAHVTDFSTGKEYSYGDHSGSWQSIRIAAGNSTVLETINAPPEQSLTDKWNNLSPVAHTAIYASAAGVGAAFLAFALYYFIKQRRRGAREAKLAEERALQERLELEQFKKAGIDPDSFVVQGSEYNAKDMRQEGLTRGDSYSVPSTPADGLNEKAWGAAAVGGGAAGGTAAAMRSPMPLLRDGAQSPRVASPSPHSPQGYRGALGPNPRSPAPLISPLRTPSPGMPPNFPPPANPANRSFSTPNAPMRMGSPGPQMGGYADMARTHSPAPMGGPGPQRSFTSGGGYGGRGGGGYGGNPGYGGRGGHDGHGDDGYWR